MGLHLREMARTGASTETEVEEWPAGAGRGRGRARSPAHTAGKVPQLREDGEDP